MNRREFLKLAAAMSVAFSVPAIPEPIMAAFKKLDPTKLPPIIYLQGQSCTGCSISLLQSGNPSPDKLLTNFSHLVFHSDLSAASGSTAVELIEKYCSGNGGDYYFALEGAIPLDMPDACVFGGKPIEEWVTMASKTASASIAVGSCAANGGIPAAEGNQTGAVSLEKFYREKNINQLLIKIPGCPVHPDWVWGTVIHIARAGLPELKDGKPEEFFGKNIHENCPRYHFFQEGIFAKHLGDEGCLFKLGCSGPVTDADCPQRWWNNGTTWCIDANAPCIGCASPVFAHYKSNPFYRQNEKNLLKVINSPQG